MKSNQNLLLMTDVYKLNHMLGYKPGTTKIYSYLCARSDKKSKDCLFFGLQPYLSLLSGGVTKEDAEEFFSYYTAILGHSPQTEIVEKINALVELGYIPLEIKAVPEGTILGNKNVLATVTNTDPRFYWVVGFFESLLLKVWNTCSVATTSLAYKRVVTKYVKETSDNDFLIPFMVHDFGYRGVSSEQTAELSGAAHLVNFLGTDTIPAVKFMKENYRGEGLIGASVFATEHSIHCSYGPTEQDEYDYVDRMLTLCPTGILSLVSDAFNYWRMLTVTLPKFKDRILARNGKVVVRPDSGFPPLILNGSIKTIKDIKQAIVEPYQSVNFALYEMSGTYYKASPADYNGDPKTTEFKVEIYTPTAPEKGTFRILKELFGTTPNSKGYEELNPKIGCIYGDAMYLERYENVLETMKQNNFSATNLVIGVGGLLLQQHNRDDLGFAFKATFATINGESVELFKDPITDSGKKSHKGLMKLVKDNNGDYYTIDQVSEAEEKEGELKQVFFNGVYKVFTLAEIRERAKC